MGNCASDFDKDDDIDGSDLLILIKDFGRMACPKSAPIHGFIESTGKFPIQK